jgi:hypothetical protein
MQENDMRRRHPVRLAALAALSAAASLAAVGAGAMEAAQWSPRFDTTPALSGQTDGTREPGAWTVGRGDATQFHDAVARDTMNSRAAVRRELAQARSRGWIADAGEAGATERVWARRAAYVTSERDPELARNPAVQTSPDPIGELAALAGDKRDEDRWVAQGPLALADSLTAEVR